MTSNGWPGCIHPIWKHCQSHDRQMALSLIIKLSSINTAEASTSFEVLVKFQIATNLGTEFLEWWLPHNMYLWTQIIANWMVYTSKPSMWGKPLGMEGGRWRQAWRSATLWHAPCSIHCSSLCLQPSTPIFLLCLLSTCRSRDGCQTSCSPYISYRAQHLQVILSIQLP